MNELCFFFLFFFSFFFAFFSFFFFAVRPRSVLVFFPS